MPPTTHPLGMVNPKQSPQSEVPTHYRSHPAPTHPSHIVSMHHTAALPHSWQLYHTTETSFALPEPSCCYTPNDALIIRAGDTKHTERMIHPHSSAMTCCTSVDFHMFSVDGLCDCHCHFCGDHLFLTTLVTEKYSSARIRLAHAVLDSILKTYKPTPIFFANVWSNNQNVLLM